MMALGGDTKAPQRRAAADVPATGKDPRSFPPALRSERKTQGPARDPTADAGAPGSNAALG
jgi:hypothetical protein